ncbi:hypothetical protein [Janibacter melonis]|uniref:hypothetical protein n=1 Tax=Janibacter melonis TaxID=262209 RepID=UPI001748DD8A|nr:hypothetical protein [Janibacter melonis]
MSTYSDDTAALIDSAASIEAAGAPPAAPEGQRPKSGMTGAEAPETYDPAQFVGKEPASPPVLPSTGGGSSSGGGLSGFVHSGSMSLLHNQIRDLHRREDFHEIGAPEKMGDAWQAVLEAKAEADAAMRAVPVEMRKAEQARADALAGATEPVALPSPADARVWAEQQARTKITTALEARRRYDAIVVEVRAEHAANLAAAVPSEGEVIRAAVSGLRAKVERLRQGVSAVVEVAASDDTTRSRRSLPRRTDLAALEALEAELEALADIAATPTEPRCEPRMSERRAIAEAARQAVSPTPDYIELARIERGEGYSVSRFTEGTPDFMLDGAAVAARYLGR